LKTGILAEKPQAAVRLREALGVRTVAALGHLLSLTKKGPRWMRWNPPYFDIGWAPPKEDSALRNRLEKIVRKLKEVDEVYVGTDYDVEGQLVALNILRYAGISPESVKRMKFSSLEKEELERAYNNPVEFDTNLALAAETRHFLDWYFGQNISKVLTQIFRKHRIRKGRKVLTPSGRVQSPTLHYLAQRERKISEFASKEVWLADVQGVDDDRNFFSITSFSFDEEEDAHAFAELYRRGVVDAIKEFSYEISYLPPNKDYVMKEALDLGISADVIDAILQDLYLDALISYPRTDSQKYLEHGVDTQKYLERLTDVFPEAKEALGRPPREGEETDIHPAIYPIRPYYETDLRGVVWKMIAEAFVKCHLPPEEREYKVTYVKIGSKTYSCHENPDLDEGDGFDLVYKIDKGRTSPPSRFDQRNVYDWMTNEEIGTRDTRSQILSNLLETYVYETSDGLYVTSKGMKIVDVLSKFSPDLIDVDLTRKFGEYVESVKSGTSPETVLEEGRKAVTRIVDVLYSNEAEIVKLLR